MKEFSKTSIEQSTIQKRNSWKKSLITLIVILIILHIIIFVIKWPYKITSTNEPLIINESYVTKEKQFENICTEKPPEFDERWIKDVPWKTDGSKVTPALIITNLEEKNFKYYVRFAFYNNTKFPWDNVNGGNPNATWDNADIYSDTVMVNLAAQESKVIEIMTDAQADPKNYWVDDRISAANLSDCIANTIYINITKTRQVVSNVKSVKKETVHLSIWEMIFTKKDNQQPEVVEAVLTI